MEGRELDEGLDGLGKRLAAARDLLTSSSESRQAECCAQQGRKRVSRGRGKMHCEAREGHEERGRNPLRRAVLCVALLLGADGLKGGEDGARDVFLPGLDAERGLGDRLLDHVADVARRVRDLCEGEGGELHDAPHFALCVVDLAEDGAEALWVGWPGSGQVGGGSKRERDRESE